MTLRGLTIELIRWLADGIKARLSFRWPQREIGKIDAFVVPSGPIDTLAAYMINSYDVWWFPNQSSDTVTFQGTFRLGGHTTDHDVKRFCYLSIGRI